MQVVSLGDLVLDVVVRAESEVARGGDTPARISLSAGGQGANVAAWVATLGGASRWLGKRADDAEGRLAADQLGDLGVELTGPVEPVGNGVIVSLVDPTGERSMFPDRGVATLLDPVELRPAWLVCDHLHVSGYALLRSLSCERRFARSTSRASVARASASISRRGAPSATRAPTGSGD